MALYAADNDDLIHAADAEANKLYHCLDCSGPLKLRQGKWRFAHFYHLKTTPTCRLYSKSVDHLVAQIEIQKLFPDGEIVIEKPFLAINRIADACWEKEKIVFEIQCSLLSEKEAQLRNQDYQSLGYRVVWLLDDKKFNKRKCSPAEQFLRKGDCYFLSIKRFRVYDQFEIIAEGKRTRRGKAFPIDLRTAQKRVGSHQQNECKKSNHFIKRYVVWPYIQWLRKRLRGR